MEKDKFKSLYANTHKKYHVFSRMFWIRKLESECCRLMRTLSWPLNLYILSIYIFILINTTFIMYRQMNIHSEQHNIIEHYPIQTKTEKRSIYLSIQYWTPLLHILSFVIVNPTYPWYILFYENFPAIMDYWLCLNIDSYVWNILGCKPTKADRPLWHNHTLNSIGSISPTYCSSRTTIYHVSWKCQS